ncbi:hypothetical protein [Mannheimia bovis]|uniref:Uncharacterized protein n=1 Tax=Mannheimia bovis TaxID=2770636 RepID=A0A7H1C0M7_9PAST|nr:hypothetical protein [Mannheimia bovis]QNS14532.1 hypothetical protein ICJ55_07120 [Mannheimia bovis]
MVRTAISAFLFMLALTLLMQCSDGEELIPTGECKPEKCEFKTENV